MSASSRMKSLDDLRRESAEALRVAKELRERREARRPVLAAYDALAAGQPLAGDTPGPRHPPRLASVPKETRDCIDCGEPIAPRDVAQDFTTCVGCAAVRMDCR